MNKYYTLFTCSYHIISVMHMSCDEYPFVLQFLEYIQKRGNTVIMPKLTTIFRSEGNKEKNEKLR